MAALTVRETGNRGLATLAPIIMVLINFPIMTVCVLIFMLSIWMISSPDSFSVFIQGANPVYLRALLPREVLTTGNGTIVAVVASVVFFVAVLGFSGAVGSSRFCLGTYSVLVSLFLLLECALFYYFTSNLVEKGVQTSDGVWAHVLRLSFDCCEYNRTSPNAYLQAEIPWSCCGLSYGPGLPNASERCQISSPDLSGADCTESIKEWLQSKAVAIYASIAGVHLLLLACSYIWQRSCASRSNQPSVLRTDDHAPSAGRPYRVSRMSRVSPSLLEPGDDMVMIMVGRTRVGWAEHKS